MNNFILWQLVSTLNTDHHQAAIEKYECIQKKEIDACYGCNANGDVSYEDY